MNGVLEARVIKLYNDSTAAKIMRMVESANENKADSVHFAINLPDIHADRDPDRIADGSPAPDDVY